MLQTVALLIDNARVVIYNRKMFITHATGYKNVQIMPPIELQNISKRCFE
jgi:hypothetical protein